MSSSHTIAVRDFGISLERGFLPGQDPRPHLPGDHQLISSWSGLGRNLPALLATGRLRYSVDHYSQYYLSVCGQRDVVNMFSVLKEEAVARLALVHLCFLESAYLIGAPGESSVAHVPAGLALPIYHISQHIKRLAPVLAHDTYVLYNWERIDPTDAICLENIKPIQLFLGGLDEHWFIAAQVVIEYVAGMIPFHILEMLKRADADDQKGFGDHFSQVIPKVQKMYEAFVRVREKCAPHAFYHRIRPYLFGSNNHELFPNGVIFDGVQDFEGQSQYLQGVSFGQSCVMQILDAAFGIGAFPCSDMHGTSPYAPFGHRDFVDMLRTVANRADVKIVSYVRKTGHTHPEFLNMLHGVRQWMHKFSAAQVEFIYEYVYRQEGGHNPIDTGSGRRDSMPELLRRARERTFGMNV